MTQIPSQSLARRLKISLIAAVIATCLLLATTVGALANTVNISDAAHVLDANQVRSEAANLPDPVSIYTTNTFTGSQSALEQRAISHITSPTLIVMAIDTVNHHLAIVGGANVALSNSQYNDAVQAFISAYKSNGSNYTASTIASIQSLRSSLGAAPVSGNNPGSNVPVPSNGGFFSGFGTIALCFLGLLVLAVAAAVIFGVMRRRARYGQPLMEPTYQPPYNQPYNQGGYPPNYGPGYYNQGGGVNPWVAGGLGAAAGGLVGYELGKEQGEDQARENDQGGNYGGNDFGGGASGDFGGGSAGDFGGGAGGDFGGGGGGDFGGGGGGSF